MSIFLLVLAVLAFLAGATTLAAAKSAVHEIEAYVLFVVFAVFLVGAAIVDAIKSGFKGAGEKAAAAKTAMPPASVFPEIEQRPGDK